jgi:hypothetical protein
MLIVALVLAVIGLAALVTAVVTSNELIAWVCIGASVIGVLLLIVDAVRERSRGGSGSTPADDSETTVLEPVAEDYPDDPATEVHPTVEPETEVTQVVETDTVSVPTEGSASADEGDAKRD